MTYDYFDMCVIFHQLKGKGTNKMVIIKEIYKGKQSIFCRIHCDENGKSLFEDTVKYRLYKTSTDNFDAFVLYDDKMNVISDAYKYVNIYMASKSYNSREKAIYAIRLFYCFLELTKSNMSDLSNDDIEKLKYFLLGYSPNKGVYSLQLKTVRRNSTVNDYLSIYRSYFKYLKIDCDYLFEATKSTIIGINPISETPTKVTSFKTNLKTGTPVKRVPRYISVEDFKKIIEIIRKQNNMLAECMVRLMYQFGLRIGEVLGLTFEDITEIDIDNKLCPVLIIRNRLSDRYFQKAKTCMNITDANQYKSKDYKEENLGFQKVIITYDIYELINNYIDKYHSIAREKNNTRYRKSVIADVNATMEM